jgi:hypothetical protein
MQSSTPLNYDHVEHDETKEQPFQNSDNANNNNNNNNNNSNDTKDDMKYNSGHSRYIPGKLKTQPKSPARSKNKRGAAGNIAEDDVDVEMASPPPPEYDSSSEIYVTNISQTVQQYNQAVYGTKTVEAQKSELFLFLYNVAMIAFMSLILFGYGIYVVSFFYFALKEDSCAWYIKDTRVGSYMPIRHYLLVTGCILVVILVATVYKSIILRGLTSHEQTIRSAKIPYWLAVLVFDIYLILGSVVFWRHSDFAKEICDHQTWKYLHDIFIVNYMVAGFLNYIISGVFRAIILIISKLGSASQTSERMY